MLTVCTAEGSPPVSSSLLSTLLYEAPPAAAICSGERAGCESGGVLVILISGVRWRAVKQCAILSKTY